MCRCSFRRYGAEEVPLVCGVLPVCGRQLLRSVSELGATFPLELGPDCVSGFSDAAFLDQFASHGRDQIIIRIEGVNALTREFALHHQSNQHLASHQTETGKLRRPGIHQELHQDFETLADAP